LMLGERKIGGVRRCGFQIVTQYYVRSTQHAVQSRTFYLATARENRRVSFSEANYLYGVRSIVSDITCTGKYSIRSTLYLSSGGGDGTNISETAHARSCSTNPSRARCASRGMLHPCSFSLLLYPAPEEIVKRHYLQATPSISTCTSVEHLFESSLLPQ